MDLGFTNEGLPDNICILLYGSGTKATQATLQQNLKAAYDRDGQHTIAWDA